MGPINEKPRRGPRPPRSSPPEPGRSEGNVQATTTSLVLPEDYLRAQNRAGGGGQGAGRSSEKTELAGYGDWIWTAVERHKAPSHHPCPDPWNPHSQDSGLSCSAPGLHLPLPGSGTHLPTYPDPSRLWIFAQSTPSLCSDHPPLLSNCSFLNTLNISRIYYVSCLFPSMH